MQPNAHVGRQTIAVNVDNDPMNEHLISKELMQAVASAMQQPCKEEEVPRVRSPVCMRWHDTCTVVRFGKLCILHEGWYTDEEWDTMFNRVS